jgi:hypothetical protein
MSNTPKRHARDGAFEKPTEVKSTTAPTPKPTKLKLHTKSPYRGGRADQRPFLREAKDRGGGSPGGPPPPP